MQLNLYKELYRQKREQTGFSKGIFLRRLPTQVPLSHPLRGERLTLGQASHRGALRIRYCRKPDFDRRWTVVGNVYGWFAH